MNIIITFTLFFSLMATNSGLFVSDDFAENLTEGKNIVIEGRVFDTDINLVEMLEFYEATPGFRQAVVNGNILFRNCTFRNFISYGRDNEVSYSVIFGRNLVFDNCKFLGNVDISYAEIKGSLFITGCKLEGDFKAPNIMVSGRTASLVSSEFFGPVKMSYSVFDNKFVMQRSILHSPVIFQNAVFKGDAMFGGATFHDHAEFSKTTFLQDCSFRTASFEGKTIFSKSKFYGEAVFTEAHFLTENRFDKVIFYTEGSFTDAVFEKNNDTEKIKNLLGE